MKRLRRLASSVRASAADILAITGVACLAIGAGLVTVPLGWLVLGAFLILAAGQSVRKVT